MPDGGQPKKNSPRPWLILCADAEKATKIKQRQSAGGRRPTGGTPKDQRREDRGAAGVCAVVAARMANLPKHKHKTDDTPDGVSQAEAAKAMQVSHRAVQRAKAVLDADPALAEKVAQGTVKVAKAEKMVRAREIRLKTEIRLEFNGCVRAREGTRHTRTQRRRPCVDLHGRAARKVPRLRLFERNAPLADLRVRDAG